MTNKEIVEKIHGYFLVAHTLLLNWVSPIFPKLTKDWWKDRVLPHLKPIDLLTVPDKYVPSLEKLDLSTLCRVTKLNLDAINDIVSVTGMQRRALNEMIDVRNHWSHNGIELPKQNIIEQDLEIIKVFFEGFGATQEDIDDVGEFAGKIKRMRAINKPPVTTHISVPIAVAKTDVSSRYYILNTNYANDPEAHADMLKNKKCAAYYTPHTGTQQWKYEIKKLQEGDVVFLFQSRKGIVAFGEVSGKLQMRDYNGPKGFEKDGEYFKSLTNFNIVKKVLTVAEIKTITKKDYCFMQTMFGIDVANGEIIKNELMKRGKITKISSKFLSELIYN